MVEEKRIMPMRHNPESAEGNIFLCPAKSSYNYFPNTKTPFLRIKQLDERNIFTRPILKAFQCKISTLNLVKTVELQQILAKKEFGHPLAISAKLIDK